jgi:hypothetical protein
VWFSVCAQLASIPFLVLSCARARR